MWTAGDAFSFGPLVVTNECMINSMNTRESKAHPMHEHTSGNIKTVELRNEQQRIWV